MCCSTLGLVNRLLIREYGRIAANGSADQAERYNDDAVLLGGLARAGVCTMHAAAAQQQRQLTARTEQLLRAPGFGVKWYIALAAACRMYGVPMLVERDGYRFHSALFDAEMSGRLYFAMRGLRYGEPVKGVLRRLHGRDLQ